VAVHGREVVEALLERQDWGRPSAMGHGPWAMGHGPWAVEDLRGAIDGTTLLRAQLEAAEARLAIEAVLGIRSYLVSVLGMSVSAWLSTDWQLLSSRSGGGLVTRVRTGERASEPASGGSMGGGN
jgi:hypothetical protein